MRRSSGRLGGFQYRGAASGLRVATFATDGNPDYRNRNGACAGWTEIGPRDSREYTMKKTAFTIVLILLACGFAAGQEALSLHVGICRSAEPFREPSGSWFSVPGSVYAEPSTSFESGLRFSLPLSKWVRFSTGFDYLRVRLRGETYAPVRDEAMEHRLQGNQLTMLGAFSIENWGQRTFGCLGLTMHLGARWGMVARDRIIVSEWPRRVYGATTMEEYADIAAAYDLTVGIGTHLGNLVVKWEALGRIQGSLMSGEQWLVGFRSTCALPLIRRNSPQHLSD